MLVGIITAIALNKAIFLFRDNVRRYSDSEHYPLNLMIFSGLPQWEWQDFYHTSLKEIPNADLAGY